MFEVVYIHRAEGPLLPSRVFCIKGYNPPVCSDVNTPELQLKVCMLTSFPILFIPVACAAAQTQNKAPDASGGRGVINAPHPAELPEQQFNVDREQISWISVL